MHLRSSRVLIQTVTAPLTRPASITAFQDLNSVTVQKAAREKLSTPQHLADKQNKERKKKMNQRDRRTEVTTKLAY